MEEVSVLSTAITHKLQLEEMHATLCQSNGDLPYEVLQEGEETYDELYELIFSRQRDASDRAKAFAVFYDCIDMVQRIKDKLSDLLAKRSVCGLPSSETQIASTPLTSLATSTTTLISPTTAILESTSGSATSSTAVLAAVPPSTVARSQSAVSPVTSSSAVLAAVPPSTVARSQGAVSPVQPWGLSEQDDVARGQEEGLPFWVDCADRSHLDVLTGHGGRGPEEGRGLCAAIVEQFHKVEDDDTVDLAAGDVVTNDDARCESL
ncbi:hypothetical protein CBR_g3921 [Chara braunii]|uniref:Uncharacterized protein n=1 Tax=Chara braunii TaxID=69332 RepID=A0A388KGQ4_CHABU|nr:hypothetical protein CBR_g3921 [Chara braunii]|eukprot:GBG69222.1 hypothetical protein CBR_g3921 [Chara braunii]